MVEKVYIIWAKINKTTCKFDIGLYTKKKIANETAIKITKNREYYKVWVSGYKLSKPIHAEGT